MANGGLVLLQLLCRVQQQQLRLPSLALCSVFLRSEAPAVASECLKCVSSAALRCMAGVVWDWGDSVLQRQKGCCAGSAGM
jgi:hypothetical protein